MMITTLLNNIKVLNNLPLRGGLVGLLLLLNFQLSMAQTTEKVLYLNVTRTSGAVVSQKLTDGTVTKNPVIDLINKKVYTDKATLSLSRVKEFAFEVKEEEVDAIRSTEIAAPQNDAVYTVEGRLVGKDADNLPKGVYVRNGRKFVVK